ncbi:MAG: ABC transporter ATP-binding protein [Candidatus Thorarchaeota archaeon]
MSESQTIIETMTDRELIQLAKTLGVPLTDRTVEKKWLIDTLSALIKDKRLGLDGFTPAKLADPAIDLQGLTKRFGKKLAVDNLDMKVCPGEIVGLVGPNGAGKTTTMRMLTGIIKPTDGVSFVNGFNVQKNPLKAKSAVGYIPERPTCYPSLRVREYLTFMARIYGTPRDRVLLRTREFVDLFQLEEYLNSFIGTLSKGNLQRTLVVGILIRDPPFILALDEPIYGLDPRGAWSLKRYLRTLRDNGSAIMISTHILEVAEGLCDRFVIMNEGRVVGRGTMEELRQQTPGTENLEEVFLELTGGIPVE